MTQINRISRLPSNEQVSGHCFVCDRWAIMRFKDNSIGASVGNCCIKFAFFADKALSIIPGIRHPQPGEAPTN